MAAAKKTAAKKTAAKKTEPAKPDVSQLIAEAKLPEKTVSLCLRGDLVAEVEQLEAELSRMPTSDRLTGNAEARKMAARIEQLQEQMHESTVAFVLRGLPRREWTRFLAKHGPRDGNEQDKAAGINTDTYFVALVWECMIAPDIDDEQYEQLIDNALTAKQWDRLASAAIELNIEDVSVPFSAAASLINQRSGEK